MGLTTWRTSDSLKKSEIRSHPFSTGKMLTSGGNNTRPTKLRVFYLYQFGKDGSGKLLVLGRRTSTCGPIHQTAQNIPRKCRRSTMEHSSITSPLSCDTG